jgi:hypothetical protein
MSEQMQQERDRQLRMYALERACAVTPKHNAMPDEVSARILKTAKAFEAFLRGEAAE